MQGTSALPSYLPYHLLEEITNGFSDERKLGSGAYGKVYLGVHKDGEKIAVKVLYDMPTFEDNEQQFQSEFNNLARVQHQNIVRLVGYCHETQQMYLPYNGGHTFAGQIRTAFCLEYMHKGSLDKYISEERNKNDWPTRYAIIKGICKGLKYLHSELELPIYHLDLKPANILLYENMLPKIADFGLSRLLGGERTQKTLNRKGTLGYIPPEYIHTGEISSKFDIFSLGVVITKIMTGPDGYFRSDEMSPEQFIESVHEEWKNKLYASPMDLYSEQVKICIKIAVNCMEFNRHKRPSIDEIVYELDGINNSGSTMDEITVVELLNVDPLQLFFPLFESNVIISRPLRLTNNTDEKVVFRCLPEPHADGFLSELRGILPPRSAHIYFVTMEQQPPANTDPLGMILESCIAHEDIPDPDDHFLTEFREQIRGRVHEVTVTAIYNPGDIMIISLFDSVRFVVSNSMDVHPTQPWFSVGQHDGHISVWDYETEARVMPPLRITEGNAVRSTRFIAWEEQWIVVGDGDGDIHVHSLVTGCEVKKFQAHRSWVQSLSVHPSLPLLLSASVDKLIKLWNWEEDWTCIRTFKGHTQSLEIVMFNPWNDNTFASVSLDCTIKVWNSSSPRPDATFGCKPHQLLCFDFLPPGDDGQHVVAGSVGGNVHIWDLKTQKCTQVIDGLQRGIGCNVGAVDCGPDDPPLLFTVSEDNTISLCNSATYRCERTGYVFNLGNVCSFVYLKRIRSVAIGFERGLAILEIN
ncbi:hypothetical protein ACQ4PT_009174 [Festuca glaucescens]